MGLHRGRIIFVGVRGEKGLEMLVLGSGRVGWGGSCLAHVPGSIATGVHATITIIATVVIAVIVVVIVGMTIFFYYTAALQARGLVRRVVSLSR